jgi:hypothetical protein
MSDLRETISDFTDRELVEACYRKKEDYTPEAMAIIREEIERRGLTEAVVEEAGEKAVDPATLRMGSEDFVVLDHFFSATDLLLASAVLRDNAVPFFTDNPSSTGMLPIETEAAKQFKVHIHKDFVAKAHELLDEHFALEGNRYLLRYEGARARLRAFNFHDLQPVEPTEHEDFEVSLTEEEKGVVIALGRRLQQEADTIEKEQDRILFYFDSIDSLLEQLAETGNTALSRNDLLTLLEILQVYIDDPALPPFMDEAISQLLSLFLGL